MAELEGLRKSLPVKCMHAPLLRMLPDYEPHDILFLVEAEEYLRHVRNPDALNRPNMSTELKRLLRKYAFKITSGSRHIPLAISHAPVCLHMHTMET